ncbi:11066_t:CDS:2, partial [Acaulospora colombiana]
MSGHWDKVIKLACKPKQASPKAKAHDGTLRDICASLAVRLREPSLV